MTLHIVKDPINSLALKVLQSELQTDSPVVVMLSPSHDLPQLPGVSVYHVTENASMENSSLIPYSRLIDMIFTAEKVVAW